MATTPLTAPAPPTAAARSVRPVVGTLLAAALVVKTFGFAWDYLGYYIADGAGYGTMAAGWGLTLFGVGWCLGQTLAGSLTDRLGHRNALTLLMTFSAVICASLAAVTSLPALLALALCLGFTMEVHRPAVSAAINAHIPTQAGRVRAQAWFYWSMNLGIALCAAAGGYLAQQYGYRLLFLANGAACLAFVVLARRALPARTPATGRSTSEGYRQVLHDRSLRWICGVTVGAMVCAWGLVSVLPLLMTSDGLPPTAYGTVMVANTVAVLVLTPVMMRWLVRRDDAIRYPLVATLAAGCGFLGLGMTVAAFQHTTLGFAISAVVVVPGEILYSVAAGAYISTAVPEHATGRYQGVLSASTALASLPPLAIAVALQTGGRPLVAVLLAASALLAALACYPLARALPADPRTTS